MIGDEGGFAPPCDVESGLQMIMEASEAAGYLDKVSVGLDVASSEFKVAGKDAYDLDFKTTGPEKDTSAVLTGDEMIAFYKKLCDEYPIVTVRLLHVIASNGMFFLVCLNILSLRCLRTD